MNLENNSKEKDNTKENEFDVNKLNCNTAVNCNKIKSLSYNKNQLCDNINISEDDCDLFNISKSSEENQNTNREISKSNLRDNNNSNNNSNSNNINNKEISNIQISFSEISNLDIKESNDLVQNKDLNLNKNNSLNISNSTNSIKAKSKPKEKIDNSCTPSVCNYFQHSNDVTPNKENNEIKISTIKQVNLNLLYNNMDININNNGISEDVGINKNINNNTTNIKKTPIKYTKAQCNNNGNDLALEKKNLMDNFLNNRLSFLNNNSNSSDKNSKKFCFIIQKNETIEFINNKNDNSVTKCDKGIDRYTQEDSNINFQINPIAKSSFEQYSKDNTVIHQSKNQSNSCIGVIDSEKKDNTMFNSKFNKTYEEKKNNINTNKSTNINKHIERNNKMLNQITQFSTSKISPFKNTSKHNTNLYSHLRTNSTKNRKVKNESKSYSRDKGKKYNCNHSSSMKKCTPRQFVPLKQHQENNKQMIKSTIDNKCTIVNNNIKKGNSIISKTSKQELFFSSQRKQSPSNINVVPLRGKINYVCPLYSLNYKKSNTQSNSKSKPISKSKSKSKSKGKNLESQHQKIKTQINLKNLLNKVESLSNRENIRNNKSIFTVKDNINKKSKDNNDIVKIESNTMKKNNSNNVVKNKVINKKEVGNMTMNNYYTAANTTISSVKKSPKIIQDFSCYKKKNSFNSHFICKSNLDNSKKDTQLNNHYPISSFKLNKLTGDNDSIDE